MCVIFDDDFSNTIRWHTQYATVMFNRSQLLLMNFNAWMFRDMIPMRLSIEESMREEAWCIQTNKNDSGCEIHKKVLDKNNYTIIYNYIYICTCMYSYSQANKFNFKRLNYDRIIKNNSNFLSI